MKFLRKRDKITKTCATEHILTKPYYELCKHEKNYLETLQLKVCIDQIRENYFRKKETINMTDSMTSKKKKF